MKQQTTYKSNIEAPERIQHFEASWESPSNIALIKYWGKKQGQIPCNASLSFALSKSVTSTKVKAEIDSTEETNLDFSFEGKENTLFADRIQKYLSKLDTHIPYLKNSRISVESNNSFPHSSGIASSASAMSALALCLLDIEYQTKGRSKDAEFYTRASFLARLGSGSAARSVYPAYVVWGKSQNVTYSSDEYAVRLPFDIHPSFQKLNDAVLITSSQQKKVSSSTGHSLMENHPWADARYAQAEKNIRTLMLALQTGDEQTLTQIVENEALSLHALMMSSSRGFSLLNSRTWAIIEEIRQFRDSQNIFLTFTLDAGPNVHLLYKPVDKKKVIEWIEQKLLVFCENNYWIDDEMGSGPKRNA